jgi:site-specific DNA-methyltransferase (adenine-specific)
MKKYEIRDRIEDIIANGYESFDKLNNNGEVFTPWELIEEMLDKLPEDFWEDPSKTMVDPAAGLGNFHAVVIERLMDGLANKIPDEEERYKHIVENQLYFVELNPDLL